MTLLPRLFIALALTSSLAAQGQLRNDKPRPPSDDEEYEEFVPEPVYPDYAVEFAISEDGLHLGFRNAFERGHGYGALELFLGEGDDWLANGRLMRFGEPAAGEPLGLGIGLGLYAGASDEPDAHLGAITLIGAIDYTLALSYPVRLGLETSYAPEASCFTDTTRLLDLQARAEVVVSDWATGFVGYRFTEADLDDAKDRELEKAAHIGVRLGI
ncbi:MAG: hypothetical protein ABL998_16405 [Planctomycetota bacterium]